MTSSLTCGVLLDIAPCFVANPPKPFTDYTRELKLHPNEGNIYPQLAGAQLAQGKRPDAEATLQRRLEAVGSDATISIQLAQMLLEDENFAEAVVVAEVAREADPTNQRLLWLLGRTRMKAGQKAAGLSTLSAALRETDDPGLRNDIAYELTDAGYATDEVEAATRKVVDQLTAETAAWTLTTPDTEMRRRSSGKGHRQRRPTLQPSRHADILFQPFSGKGRVVFFAQRQIIQAISSMLRLVFPRFTVHLALTASSPFLYAQAHNWPLDGGVQRRSRRNPGGDRAHQTRAVCKRHCAL